MSNLLAPEPELAPKLSGFIACVRAMGKAQDRMHYVAPEPWVPREPSVRRATSPGLRLVELAADSLAFAPHERAVYRALALKFPPEKCVEMVLRSRKAVGA